MSITEGTPATDLITEERLRQISAEGWTEEHDDQYDDLDLMLAAFCYGYAAITMLDGDPYTTVPEEWPWDVQFWKPGTDPIRCLVKAGALIAAEVDRLQRAEARATEDWAGVTGYED